MKHFLFQSQGHMCVQQRSTVNGQPCKPHLGSLCQAQGKMFQQYHKLLHARWVRYMSSIHLDSVLGFKLPRYLRPRYLCVISPCKIAIVIRAKKKWCHFQLCQFESKPPRKSKLANQIPHCHSKVLRFFLHNEGMVNTCFRCKPNWAHRLLVIQLAT